MPHSDGRPVATRPVPVVDDVYFHQPLLGAKLGFRPSASSLKRTLGVEVPRRHFENEVCPTGYAVSTPTRGACVSEKQLWI